MSDAVLVTGAWCALAANSDVCVLDVPVHHVEIQEKVDHHLQRYLHLCFLAVSEVFRSSLFPNSRLSPARSSGSVWSSGILGSGWSFDLRWCLRSRRGRSCRLWSSSGLTIWSSSSLLALSRRDLSAPPLNVCLSRSGPSPRRSNGPRVWFSGFLVSSVRFTGLRSSSRPCPNRPLSSLAAGSSLNGSSVWLSGFGSSGFLDLGNLLDFCHRRIFYHVDGLHEAFLCQANY